MVAGLLAVGEVVSLIVNVCVAVDVLLQESVTEKVLVTDKGHELDETSL